jgi:hypothetical protein
MRPKAIVIDGGRKLEKKKGEKKKKRRKRKFAHRLKTVNCPKEGRKKESLM